MKKLFVILLLQLVVVFSWSQETKTHQIVFQLNTSDTLSHKALMKQIGNILTLSPTTKIEVVCHGPGLNMLLLESSVVKKKVNSFAEMGVEFMACQFSMKERGVSTDAIFSSAHIVPGGILEIVQKQESGWSYIKAGI